MAAAKPQAIHILTPPASHCALTLEALEMGCHVLVEKPMADTAEECDQMIAKAKATGRVLSVGHSARMDPIVLKALELVKRGACGDILSVDFFRSSDYPPYPGELFRRPTGMAPIRFRTWEFMRSTCWKHFLAGSRSWT